MPTHPHPVTPVLHQHLKRPPFTLLPTPSTQVPRPSEHWVGAQPPSSSSSPRLLTLAQEPHSRPPDRSWPHKLLLHRSQGEAGRDCRSQSGFYVAEAMLGLNILHPMTAPLGRRLMLNLQMRKLRLKTVYAQAHTARGGMGLTTKTSILCHLLGLLSGQHRLPGAYFEEAYSCPWPLGSCPTGCMPASLVSGLTELPAIL